MSEKPLIKVGNATLYRLGACTPVRKQWQAEFGFAMYGIEPSFIRRVLLRGFSIGWFLVETCGPETLFAICDAVDPSLADEIAAALPPGDRVCFREMLDGLYIRRKADWLMAQPTSQKKIAAWSFYASRDPLHNEHSNAATRRRAAEVRTIRLCEALGLLARAGRDADTTEASRDALYGAIQRHSRVINRTITLRVLRPQ